MPQDGMWRAGPESDRQPSVVLGYAFQSHFPPISPGPRAGFPFPEGSRVRACLRRGWDAAGNAQRLRGELT